MNLIKTISMLIIKPTTIAVLSCNRTDDLYTIKTDEMLQIGTIDERYQSVDIEMCEIVGGDFWIPYGLIDPTKVAAEGLGALKFRMPPADLYDNNIRKLAGALGPMYIRVSGTWANTTYFQDNDEPKLASAPEGYENVLTRAEWKGVIDFCEAIDAKLVTSFAISDGIRDWEGNWTPVQMSSLINYTKSIGGGIVAAEMFNEPSYASYGGEPINYDAGEITFGVDIFVHSSKQYSGGKSALIINTLDSAYSVNVPLKTEQYLITADSPEAKKVKLNGNELNLTDNGELLLIYGIKTKAGEVVLPPKSILFMIFK